MHDECNTSEVAGQLHSGLPTTMRSTKPRSIVRSVLIVTMAICVLLAVLSPWLPVAFVSSLLGENRADIEHGNVCIDLSPDGRTVVFSSADGDLYTFDINTRTARQLTATERIESYPSYSPDGEYIVFSAANGNTAPSHVYLLDLKTLGVEQLTSETTTSDILPRFKPDGKRVVFARAYRHRPYSLGGWTWDKWDACEIARDGTGFVRLTAEEYYSMFRVVPRLDGSIIYAATEINRNPFSHPPFGALYAAGSSGKPKRLIPGPSQVSRDVHGWATDPILAPDGVTLAYCSDRQQPFWYDVCISNGDDKPRCLVGTKSRYNSYPAFFPDGDRILFLAGTEVNAGSRPIYALWEVTNAGTTKEIATSDLFTNPAHWLPAKSAMTDVE